jgi:hypothetical protein
MTRKKLSIEDLVKADRLERIEPDSEEALDLLHHAQTHLKSAEKLMVDDPAGAYQLLYDAARKAVAADMLSNGYRAKSDRPGAHAAVVLYAEEALRMEEGMDALANLDRMRRSRNRTEYGGLTLSSAQVKADLEHARTLVALVSQRLEGESREE